MFSYLVSHFFNHSLGLISLDAMEAALYWIFRFWTSWPGSIALYGAFLTHFLLALYALWARRSLRLSRTEIVQYALGFLVPLMLADHVVGTRVSDAFYKSNFGYYRSLLTVYFHEDTPRGVVQAVVLVVAWVHGCIGLRFWLRLKPWYERAQPFLYAFALLLPVCALLGYYVAGRHVAVLAQDPAWVAQTFQEDYRPPLADQQQLEKIAVLLRLFFIASIGGVLLARLARRRWQRRHGVSRVTYPDGRFVDIARGFSVLEASRLLGVPHAAVCGGRGRCSTCRVRVQGNPAALPPPSAEEAKVLRRIAAGPMVRLACQLRPLGDLRVTPLLPPFAQAKDGFPRPGITQGGEREIAIMFADLRDFTRLAETRLPYDVVFILNRYFAAMGHAVEEAGGHLDKFIGDGVMALFGIESGKREACRAALDAAALMSKRLVELNRALEHDLDTPLRIGIGLHFGPTIVGEIGYGKAISLTAVGDAVNIASRLETATKEYACELVVSEELIDCAGADLTAFPRHEIEIRGRRQPLAVRTLVEARELPEPGAPAAAVPAK
ncbi:MAG: adenylate/guanylate cyclase [Rhodospirillales bacterium]|jgi:adenylate cyclase|nr:adenylate/guanylate cyclase [Rhodospirillales bacterium]